MPKEEIKVSPLALIAGALVLIALVTFAILQNREHQGDAATPEKARTEAIQQPQPEQPAPAASAATDFQMPPFHQPAELTALPPTKDPLTVSPGAMTAYQVAQQKPKLLAQLPCFCYCDRFGHSSLHDCYVGDHAQSCDICLKEALEADRLDKEGMPANQIRDVIVAQFHPRNQDHAH